MQPPFLRPQLSEAQLAAKILDNGIQGDPHRVKKSDLKNKKINCLFVTGSCKWQPVVKMLCEI